MQKIILASKSPRRKEMLGKYIDDLTIETMEVEEHVLEEFSPQVNVMSLAFEKAKPIAELHPNDIVIGADTIVVYDGKIMGKPTDRTDAFNMLKLLSGVTHEVYSGFSILSGDRKVLGYDISQVSFKDLTDEEIEAYLDTDEYIDKAGAYGIQGYGEVLVKTISGHFENIVGLPISVIYDVLKKYFGYELLRGK